MGSVRRGSVTGWSRHRGELSMIVRLLLDRPKLSDDQRLREKLIAGRRDGIEIEEWRFSSSSNSELLVPRSVAWNLESP
jgi:hypothetical protein